MKGAFLAVALALLALALAGRASAQSIPLTPQDMASFYASPWESVSVLNVTVGGSSYYLVLLNETNQTNLSSTNVGGLNASLFSFPVALLSTGPNDTYPPVLDVPTLYSALDSVRPELLEQTGLSVDQAVAQIQGSSYRQDAVQAHYDYYIRSQEYAQLSADWLNLSTDFENYRGLSVPTLSPLFTDMSNDLVDMGEANSPAAIEEYAYSFDGYYFQALSLYESYVQVYPYYGQAVTSLLNASRTLNYSMELNEISSDQATSDSRSIEALWASVDSAEAIIINGKGVVDYAEPLLEQVTENATAINSQVNSPPQGSDYLTYIVLAVMAVLVSLAGAFAYLRRKKGGGGGGSGPEEGERNSISHQLEDVFSKIREMDRL